MKKMFLAVLTTTALGSASMQAQGMWFPHEVASRTADMKAKGMVMKPATVYSATGGGLNESVVHFGGFCTGEVISSKGLVLTNHHCGYDAIQSHSSLEDNLLE
ncbi:MAG: S46 family peptidase, partial [Bacteroidetes bacterium]|nr:S46 family peptidase [Bacteroidota bacterium]